MPGISRAKNLEDSMKKKKIRKRIEKAIKSKQICRIYTEYDREEPFRFLPLKISDELLYLVKDGDQAANGCSVRCLDVIEKVKIEDDAAIPVPRGEVTEQITAPDLDITDWQSVFKSLGKYGKVVIVESQKLAKKDGRYAVGKIEKVGRKQVTICYYGPDPVWENKRWKISYENVTWVTIDSRYTEVLNQYVPEEKAQAEVVIEKENEDLAEEVPKNDSSAEAENNRRVMEIG